MEGDFEFRGRATNRGTKKGICGSYPTDGYGVSNLPDHHGLLPVNEEFKIGMGLEQL